MNVALAVVGLLIKYGPEVYAAAVELIHKKDPTQADYMALHALVKTAESSADQAVADAKA